MKFLRSLKWPVISGITFFASVAILSVVYAAYTAVPSATNGEPLKSSDWNTMVWDLADHETRIGSLISQVSSLMTWGGNSWSAVTGGLSYTGGNVGIGTPNPGTKLEVNGTVKATNIYTNGSQVLTLLAQCGGPCWSDHGINAWHDVGAYGYTWTTPMNTDTSVFTSNNHGIITVNKPGLYLVTENFMMIPTTDRAWIGVWCPFINGSSNCGTNSSDDVYHHAYIPAWWWRRDNFDTYFQLAAGDTISYAYYIYWAMTYWAHDGYTSLRVTRIN